MTVDKAYLSIAGKPIELELGRTVPLMISWDGEPATECEGKIVAVDRDGGVPVRITVQLVSGPHPGYIVYIDIESGHNIPGSVRQAQHTIRDHFENPDVYFGEPKPVTVSGTMRCNLCEPPSNEAIEEGWEPFICPMDEIGVTLMQQHLLSEHGVRRP
jgi:hypothetical protein